LPWVRGKTGDGAAGGTTPSDAAGDTAPATAATATGARVLLATADPVFAALCKHALEAGAGPHPQVVPVSPSELLQAARQIDHDVLLLDADRLEVAALKVLAGKVMLVSDAPVIVLSAYLAPGSPGLATLLQSIPAHFVQKPQGSSSLSLADQDGPAFVTALQAAFSAHRQTDFGADKSGAGGDGNG
jgi:chemotaxis response regulator CheB